MLPKRIKNNWFRSAYLKIVTNEKGNAVITTEPIKQGDTILYFDGKQIKIKDLPKDNLDYYMQISNKTAVGPSGKVDDYLNHSCAPNGAVIIEKSKLPLFNQYKIKDKYVSVRLIALRPIEAGEEITYDYSVTQKDIESEFDCKCGSDSCRGFIDNFENLPKKIKKCYKKMNLVPNFLKKKE